VSDIAPATCDRQNGFLRTEECLIGAIVRSPALTVLEVADFIDPQDYLDDPARVILSAAIDLAQIGPAPTPEVVTDELRRSGQLDRRTACWLACATTHDTPPGSVRRYAGSRPKFGVKARAGSRLRRQHTGGGNRAVVTPPRSWPLMVLLVTRRGSRSGCFGGPGPTIVRPRDF
jgi:hypothetical protein